MTHASVSLSAAALRRALALRHAALARAATAVERSPTATRVHQARVAARRLRSVLRTLADLVDPVLAARVSRDLRNFAIALELLREADVRREWLGGVARQIRGLPPGMLRQLRVSLAANQREARARLVRQLARPAWRARLERLADDIGDPRLVTARGDLAPRVTGLLARQWDKARRALREAGDDPEALHAARIRAKRARYSCEVLLPLLAIDPRPWVKSFKRVQACLGEHHDATDALVWLAQLGEPSGPALLGQLRRSLQAIQRRCLAEAVDLCHRLPKFSRLPSRRIQPVPTPSSEPMK